MKLQNKKTGEVLEEVRSSMDSKDRLRIYDMLTDKYYTYNSLAELNEEWEDYEEPKKHYSITQFGDVIDEVDGYMSETIDEMKEIGNYFDTREEAEKTVEKLKAWKRLKDKGFRFTGVAGISNNIFVSFETDSKYSCGHVMYDKYSNTDNNLREYNEDLMMLFGGEE